MTDAMGQYIGGGERSLPPSVIQNMKKNMKKVPVIQEKSEYYHSYEEKEAERLIEEQLQKNNEQGKVKNQPITKNGAQKKEKIFQKLVNYLKRYLKNFYNINKK